MVSATLVFERARHTSPRFCRFHSFIAKLDDDFHSAHPHGHHGIHGHGQVVFEGIPVDSLRQVRWNGLHASARERVQNPILSVGFSVYSPHLSGFGPPNA